MSKKSASEQYISCIIDNYYCIVTQQSVIVKPRSLVASCQIRL